MAPKRKLRPSSEKAGPSRPAKSREFTSSFPEKTADPSILEMQHMIRERDCMMEELQAEIRAQNCNIEKHCAEIRARNCKTEELQIREQNCKMEELQAEIIRAQNCKIEKLCAEIRARNCKTEELQVDGIDEQNPSILTNLTTREPANRGHCELKLMNDIKKRVYTDSEVQGQDGELLKVAICYNGQKITSEPLASAKFEVLVLDGNFSANDQESWTSDKFQESLVKPRKEVGPILAHDYISQFSNGEAVLEGLKFKDNSSWAPGKNWQLGIRSLEKFDVKIQEAISNPFRVLDRHGKESEKPDTPLLVDGVECLIKVGDKRASDLKEKNGIYTVKEFLQLYHKNPTKLREILKIKSKSDESWNAMIRHAKKCDAGSNLYSYRKKNTVLFFNCVYEVVGVEYKNRYRAFDKLRDPKKILINKWKQSLYENNEIESLVADFELLNGQPVPIEHNATGNSTDDDAPQHDQAAVLHNRQPAYNSEPDIRKDADPNTASGHNTTQHNDSIPVEIANQVQGHEGFSVVRDSTLELESTLVNENSVESVEESCHVMDVSSGREIPHARQYEPILRALFSPVPDESVSEADLLEWIAVLEAVKLGLEDRAEVRLQIARSGFRVCQTLKDIDFKLLDQILGLAEH